MPTQTRTPLPALASNLDSMDERLRALEQRRLAPGGTSLPAATVTTSGTASLTPAGWSFTADCGPTGLLVVYVQVTVTNTDSSGADEVNVSVTLDSGSPTVVAQGVVNSLGSLPVIGASVYTGLSHDTAHTAQISVQGLTAGFTYTWSAPFMVIWPL